MTCPTGHAAKIEKSSSAEALRHFDHAGGKSEFWLVGALPIFSFVAMSALYTERLVNRPHPGLLHVLSFDPPADCHRHASEENESRHGAEMLAGHTAERNRVGTNVLPEGTKMRLDRTNPFDVFDDKLDL
jgi:hypothetical protein